MHELIVVGASWGGLEAISKLLSDLPAEIDAPLVIAQHRHSDSTPGGLVELLQAQTDRTVEEAEDKLAIGQRRIYVAPPDYHLLVERGSLALSVDERVQFARPSIDVLFESAADAYGSGVIGIILTGANEDGAFGAARIKERGGVVVIQEPTEATRRTMPDAAIAATAADVILPLSEMGKFLRGLYVGTPPVGERVS